MGSHYEVVPREVPPQTGLARELRGILRSTGSTGRHYARLDAILVNVQRRDYPRLVSIYQNYQGGGRAFLADLEHFVGRIPLHPGEDATRARQGYRDRWTTRLYDAGVHEVQRHHQSPRPITPTPENLVRWKGAWREYFQSPEGRTHGWSPIALWILDNWNQITTGGGQAQFMQRLGWVIQTRGNHQYAGSYSILSEQPTAHTEGRRAGLSYFGALSGRHDEILQQTIERAQAYNESYVAYNYPLWRGRTKPFGGASAGLNNVIMDLYQLNRQIPLPSQAARNRIAALHELLSQFWQRARQAPPSVLRRAGINASGGLV